MILSYAAIASLLASVAYSQTIASEVAQIPSCALTCLTTAISGAGCGLTDYACQCGSAKNAITSAATPCVASSCSTSDILKVESVTSEICVIQAASGGGSSSAASVATSAGTTSPAGTTSSPSTSTSSAVSNISNIGSVLPTSSAASATSSAASTTTSTPAQVSGSPGNRLQAGGIVAGAAALMALIL